MARRSATLVQHVHSYLNCGVLKDRLLSPSVSGIPPNHVTVARVGNGVADSLVQCLLQGITQSLAVSLRTTSLTFSNSTWCSHSAYVFCTDPRSICNFYLIQSTGCLFYNRGVTVYCAVGTESYKPDYVLSLKCYITRNLSSSATRWKQPNGARVLLVIIFYDCIQWWRIWLRQCVTSRKDAGSISDCIIEILIDIILPAALWTLGSTGTPIEMSSRNIHVSCGWKGSWCVGFTSPTSCADCLDIWEPQPPGTLRAWNRPV